MAYPKKCSAFETNSKLRNKVRDKGSFLIQNAFSSTISGKNNRGSKMRNAKIANQAKFSNTIITVEEFQKVKSTRTLPFIRASFYNSETKEYLGSSRCFFKKDCTNEFLLQSNSYIGNLFSKIFRTNVNPCSFNFKKGESFDAFQIIPYIWKCIDITILIDYIDNQMYDLTSFSTEKLSEPIIKEDSCYSKGVYLFNKPVVLGGYNRGFVNGNSKCSYAHHSRSKRRFKESFLKAESKEKSFPKKHQIFKELEEERYLQYLEDIDDMNRYDYSAGFDMMCEGDF